MSDAEQSPARSQIREESTVPSRRRFLKAVGAAVIVTPAFLTFGARAADETPLERAQRYIGNARDLVGRARETEGEAQRQLATEAHTELTEARTALSDASAADREELAGPMLRLERQIDDLLD